MPARGTAGGSRRGRAGACRGWVSPRAGPAPPRGEGVAVAVGVGRGPDPTRPDPTRPVPVRPGRDGAGGSRVAPAVRAGPGRAGPVGGRRPVAWFRFGVWGLAVMKGGSSPGGSGWQAGCCPVGACGSCACLSGRLSRGTDCCLGSAVKSSFRCLPAKPWEGFCIFAARPCSSVSCVSAAVRNNFCKWGCL